MKVKIKARLAILTEYMNLLGFEAVSIKARVTDYNGNPRTVRGKDELTLDQLEDLRGRLTATFDCSQVVITLKGYHVRVEKQLSVNRSIPLAYALDNPGAFLSCAIRDLEEGILRALHEKAKSKAVIPAADLL